MPGGAAAKGWAKIMSAGASALLALADLWNYFFGSENNMTTTVVKPLKQVGDLNSNMTTSQSRNMKTITLKILTGVQIEHTSKTMRIMTPIVNKRDTSVPASQVYEIRRRYDSIYKADYKNKKEKYGF